jgi:hypothetical protein
MNKGLGIDVTAYNENEGLQLLIVYLNKYFLERQPTTRRYYPFCGSLLTSKSVSDASGAVG